MKVYWYLMRGSMRPTGDDSLQWNKRTETWTQPPARCEGRVIGVVRKWWRNYLVVALDSGAITEVPAKYCRMVL